jgi:hypothetical protein
MSDKTHKILATLGAVLVVLLPIVAHSAYGANATVRLVLDSVSAVLAALGFTVARPLVGASSEPLPLPPPPPVGK